MLTAGSALCTDCTVQEGQLEVNESILTGESESIIKKTGDKLLSGSSVIAGHCLAKVECGAAECFTSTMVNEVKRTSGGSSELLEPMKKVAKLTGFFIVPLGVLLFVQTYFFRGDIAG